MDQKVRVEVSITPKTDGQKSGILSCLFLAILYPILLAGLTIGVIFLLNKHII